MKRVSIPQPHQIEVIADDVPVITAPDEVLVEVRTIGICGSDLHTFEGQHPFVSYPVLPGHEVCGIVREVGQGVDGALIGKKVALEPSLIGGDMPRFESGRYNICSDLRVMGFQAPGAMANFFVAPLDRLHVLPDSFSESAGALVEPLAVAVHAARLPHTLAGLDVAVIGAGTIGLLTAQVARAYGAANVHVVDLDASRRAIAQQFDLEVRESVIPQHYDILFECVGVEASMRAAIQGCRKGATIVVLGVFGRDISLPFGLVQDWELRILGSLMYVGDDYREAIRLVAQQLVDVEALITHRYPLDAAPDAFHKALERSGVLKVLLESQTTEE